MSDDRLPADTTLGAVCLAVEDIDRESEFYREIVGLRVLESTEERRVLGVGDRPIVVLSPVPEFVPRPADAAGLYHLAVRVPDRAALGAALERVRTHHRLDGASDHGFSEALYLQDPEGNGVEIYRDRDRNAWPRRDDGGIRMAPPGRLDLEGLVSESTAADAAPPETDLGHVHLEVTDLRAARSFYLDTLGFELVSSYGVDALFVSAGGYHHHVAVNTWGRRTAPASGGGLRYVEVRVPSVNALETLADRIGAAEYEFDRSGETVRVRDPDGIEVRVHVEG